MGEIRVGSCGCVRWVVAYVCCTGFVFIYTVGCYGAPGRVGGLGVTYMV